MKKIYYFTAEELVKILYRATMKETESHPSMMTSEIGGGITFNVFRRAWYYSRRGRPNTQ